MNSVFKKNMLKRYLVFIFRNLSLEKSLQCILFAMYIVHLVFMFQRNMNKEHNCKNVGCLETFSWHMQVIRHRAKGKYFPPVTQKKYHFVDGKQKCRKCSKEFSHQTGVARHVTKTDCMKKKVEYKCRVCSKIFLYKFLDIS